MYKCIKLNFSGQTYVLAISKYLHDIHRSLQADPSVLLYFSSLQRRILKYTRGYYFESISPFSLAIALPDNYGFNIIKFKNNVPRDFDGLGKLGNWSVHPEW